MSPRTPQESREALKDMATAVVCLLIVLAAARGALWLTEAQEAKRRAEAEASIEYVDESGKPISKDRALARLKQLEATKKSESRSTSTTMNQYAAFGHTSAIDASMPIATS